MDATVRPAAAGDVPALAAIFGRAFEDYRRGLGVDVGALSRLWQPGLAARVGSTLVAALPDGRVAGFVVMIRPGQKEWEGGWREEQQQAALWRRELGISRLWRLPAVFIPMALAYARRRPRKDEVYISLIAVDPPMQRRGIGQALLGAAETEARAASAAAMLLHTASTNLRAQTTYRRAGYELVCTVQAPWPGPARIPAYLALRKPLRPEPTPLLDRLSRTSPPGPLSGAEKGNATQ